MEALVALAIFGISVTGIVSAIHASTSLVRAVDKQRWIITKQKQVLKEVLTMPQTLDEFKEARTILLDDFGAEAQIEITPLEINNEQGSAIQNLYQIRITLEWLDNLEKKSEVIEVQHYFPLFQY